MGAGVADHFAWGAGEAGWQESTWQAEGTPFPCDIHLDPSIWNHVVITANHHHKPPQLTGTLPPSVRVSLPASASLSEPCPVCLQCTTAALRSARWTTPTPRSSARQASMRSQRYCSPSAACQAPFDRSLCWPAVWQGRSWRLATAGHATITAAGMGSTAASRSTRSPSLHRTSPHCTLALPRPQAAIEERPRPWPAPVSGLCVPRAAAAWFMFCCCKSGSRSGAGGWRSVCV